MWSKPDGGDLRRQNPRNPFRRMGVLNKGRRPSSAFVIFVMINAVSNGHDPTPDSLNMLQRIAGGDRTAVGDCTTIHGPLIWAWARKFTSSTSDAETATRQIFIDILDAAPNFDANKCSEITYIKQICIRRLMSGVSA